MDHGNHGIIREVAGRKTVVANCAGCDKTIGDFCEFHKSNSRTYWATKMEKLDWNINFKVEDKKISCECGKPLGKMLDEDKNALFERKAINLKY